MKCTKFQYEPCIGKCYENREFQIFVAYNPSMMFKLHFCIVMGMSFLHISHRTAYMVPRYFHPPKCQQCLFYFNGHLCVVLSSVFSDYIILSVIASLTSLK